MNGKRVVAVGLVTLAFGALGATAARAWDISKTMPAGGRLELGGHMSVNPDCTTLSEPTIRVTTPPTHGATIIHKGRSFPSFPDSNPRNVCNTRRVPSVIIDYKPEAGFVGSDYVAIEVFYEGGTSKTFSYAITVK